MAISNPIYERFTPGGRRMIFFCALLACVVSSMLNTVLNTVLPAVMLDFSISSDTGQWLSSGYSLAMAIAMPLTAFLSSRVRTRSLYLSALAVFAAGVVLSALAPNFEVMMLGRVVQACGNGVISALVQVVLLTIYPPNERGQIMGWYGLSVGAAPVIAPTLGGIVADAWGWRYIFYFAIALMVLAFVGAMVFFKDALDTHQSTFDCVSFVLSALVFGGITLGMGNLSSQGIASPMTLVPLAVGIIATPIFVRRQNISEEPFLDVSVFSNRTFTLATVASMILYFVMMAASIMAPLYVQGIAGQSATVSGLAMLPGSLCMALLSPVTGRLFDRMGMKSLLIAGGLTMAVSSAGMLFADASVTGVWLLAVLFVVRSAAIAALMMPLVTWGVGALPDSKNGHGTAFISSLRTLAGALGTAVGVGVMNVAGAWTGSALVGLHVSFAMLAVLSVLLVVIGLIAYRKKA